MNHLKALDLETVMLILEKFDAIAVTDTNGEYIYANQNWLNTFHTTLEKLSGLHPWDLLADTRIKEVLETREPIIGHTLNSTEAQGFVSYYPITKDGEFFGVLIWVFYTWMDTAYKFSQMVSRLTQELETTTARLHALSTANYDIDCITGNSPAMVRLREEIVAAAQTNTTVLIEGETGVGKELVAHSIHDLSIRCAAPLVRVNCSSLTEDSAYLDLFGCEDSHFNGGNGNKTGKFEAANGGSLFLDEIDQLPLTIQPKLLRVLQEHEIERMGGKSAIPLDLRVIAVTNTSLEDLVARGAFRNDLYYRLNVLRLHVPSLRDRKEDIPALTNSFISRFNKQFRRNIQGVDDAVLEQFQQYDWPGNVRELQNALESAFNRVSQEESTLKLKHFASFFEKSKMVQLPTFSPAAAEKAAHKPLAATKLDAEYKVIKDAIIQANGNKSIAAKILGISRNTLYKKLAKYPDL